MSQESQMLLMWFAPLMALIGVGVWLLRGEGRTNANADAITSMGKRMDTLELTIKTLENAHGALALKLVEELGKIRESLARIEGRGNAGD